jgi:hypothetical protein
MRRVFRRGVASAFLLSACSAGLVVAAACSSSNGGGGGSGGDGGGSSSGTGSSSGSSSSAPSGCTNTSGLQIHFAPMYSAFLTDNSAHQTFQVPAVATGGSGTATWTASDSTAVSFTADPTSGGTLITVLSASTPTVTITAQEDELCGSTTLNITAALEADWAVGNARYNNGVPVIPGCIDGRLAPQLAEAGIDLPPAPDSGCPDAGPACTGCHGPTSTSGFFKGVLHTPEQTAGFSDQALINIFVNGEVEDGGAFNPSILPYYYWNLFHTWSDISTPEEQKGMVVYLRSLTPAQEEGGLNFGGLAEAGVTGP